MTARDEGETGGPNSWGAQFARMVRDDVQNREERGRKAERVAEWARAEDARNGSSGHRLIWNANRNDYQVEWDYHLDQAEG